MNRRSAILLGFTVATSVLLIPSCMQPKSKSYPGLKNISVSEEQAKLLELLAAAIIPETTTPGAVKTGAPDFILRMVDDCYDPENRTKFVSGLSQFESISNKRYGHSFIACSESQRNELLNALESKKDVEPEAIFFYNSAKKLTLQCYSTSSFYLTKIHPYEMVPGRFHGCVPVKHFS